MNPKLWLDPNTVILPSKGWLRVLNRRGLTKIQADHIDEVHQKLKPYLDGNYREAELISAVAVEKQPVLEKYFTAMSQAGALHRGHVALGDGGMTIQQAGHDQGGRSLLIKLNGKAVFVSLDGKDPADAVGHPYDARVMFVTPRQMGLQWKRIWRARKRGPHLLYVIEERGPGVMLNQADLAARKQYAVWFLGCSRMDSWPGRSIRLYKLDRAGPALTPLFHAWLGGDEKLAAIRITADLVTVTDHDQIPLVIAKAAVPFYPNSVAGCGLDYGLLSDQLAREFIVQATLDSQVEREDVSCTAEVKDCESAGTQLRRIRVDRKAASAWSVAGSLLHLRARALERFCWDSSERDQQGSTRAVDLLQCADKHPQIAYLTGVLRTRRHTLPAQAQVTAGGLHVCQAGKHQAYSLIEAKAIRDVLLASARDEFYPESLNGIVSRHECDFAGFLADGELEQLVRRQNEILDSQRLNRGFTFKHVQHFGISAWIGTLGHAN
ncbi:MAG TPA: hypothetical protein VI636_16705 [Candidatus Angelobacter sp.]